MQPIPNESAPFVRFRAQSHKRRAKPNRRIEKTRALLHQALGSLIVEKPYDSIAVREILERANVGRSTFYTHFRDKDELLGASIHEMVGSFPTSVPARTGSRYETFIAFSLPVFEHLDQHRRAHQAGMGMRGKAMLHEHLQTVLTEAIAEALENAALEGPRDRCPLDLLARYIASTFVLVLNWWVDSPRPIGVADVNDLFRALVIPTLSTISCYDG